MCNLRHSLGFCRSKNSFRFSETSETSGCLRSLGCQGTSQIELETANQKFFFPPVDSWPPLEGSVFYKGLLNLWCPSRDLMKLMLLYLFQFQLMFFWVQVAVEDDAPCPVTA